MIKKLWELLNNSFVGLVIGVGLTLFQFWIEEKEYGIGYAVMNQTSITTSKDSVINAVEIALFNNGDLYIDKSMISATDPLRLISDDTIHLISHRMLCKSRSNFSLTIDSSLILHLSNDDGLEKYDGAKIQLIYYGLPGINWHLIGRIKGAGHPFKEYSLREMDKFRPMPWYAMPVEIILFIIFSWIIIMCHIYSSLNILSPAELKNVFFSYCFYGGLLILNIIILWNHIFYAGDLEWLFAGKYW